MSIKVFLLTLVFLIVVDFLWIGIVANSFYATHLAEIGNYQDGKIKVVYWAALMVYVLLAGGICVYALPLAMAADSLLMAAAYGAGFGFVTYGIYDFTNYATLKSYPLILLIGDLTWGTFVCGLATTFAFYVQKHWA